MNQLEQGRAHLANGEVKEAIVAFWAATQEDESVTPWYGLALSLALAGRWEDFVRVVNIAEPMVTFFHSICVDLMQRGEYQALSEMHRSIPETHVISPVAIYFAGVCLIAEKRYVEAMEYFQLFRQRVLANQEHYRTLLQESDFNLIFRQATLVEPPNLVAALEQGTIAVEEADPVLTFHQKASVSDSAPLFACSLNDLYFLRFSETLVSSLAQRCGKVCLHFNVIGDRSDCLDHFKALEARYPEVSLGLSIEREPLARHSAYYACSRFIALPQLFEAYERNIMMLDADAVPLQDLTPLYQRLSAGQDACDFACFDTGRTEPASVYQATLMFFARTPGCEAFVRLVRRFVFLKLDSPRTLTWLLDQASVFSVSLFLETQDERTFAFQRLDRLTGCDMADFVDSAGTDEEKVSLRHEGSPV